MGNPFLVLLLSVLRHLKVDVDAYETRLGCNTECAAAPNDINPLTAR